MPQPIHHDSDTLSLPPRLAAHRARQHHQRQLERPATRTVIVGYASEPSQNVRAQDGTALYDPITVELEPGVFAGLREVAAGICGMQVHQVVELPEGTPQSQLGRLAEIVKAKRAGRNDLPPCCRVVREIGKREKMTF
nr:hypothetical protein [Armatimonas sp.]